MKKTLLILAPVAMLALAACNKSETPAEGEAAAGAEATKEGAAPMAMPPSITASGVYRCADSTVLHVDFLGANEAADIRVSDKTAAAIRVNAPAAATPAADAAAAAPTPAPSADEAAPAGPMKSADGEAMLSGSGKSINVKLPGKGAQSCKS